MKLLSLSYNVIERVYIEIERYDMSLWFLIFTICFPFVHLKFVKQTLARRKTEFKLAKLQTLEVMYKGSFSSIFVASFLVFAELLGIDVRIGELGYLFAITTSVLAYQLYISKIEGG